MNTIWINALLSTLIVSLISFVGIFILFFKTGRLQQVLTELICFSIGAMLGNAFFHLIPESYFHIGSAELTSWLILVGFLVFFIVEHFLHAHHDTSNLQESPIKPFGYLSLYANSIHNLTDGILIGAAWMFNNDVGLATTFAVIFHEIPHEIGDFGILIRAGFTNKKAIWLNFLVACTAIVGTLITLWIGKSVEHLSTYILPIAAGGFIYLAAANLLPEVLKESTKKNLWIHLLFILLGLFLMYFFSVHGGHQH